MRTLESYNPPGLPGTARTIAAMHALVREGVRDVRVANVAKAVLRSVPRRDYRAEAQALLSYAQHQCRYVRDPVLPDGIERVSHPMVTVQTGGGDCDDLSVVLASLLASVGFDYAFRTIGDDARQPDLFRHVYVVAYVPPLGWVAADPSFEEPLGWEPSRRGTLLLPDGTTVAAAEVVRDWPPT